MIMNKKMQPRHQITDKYNNNPRHKRRWELTIEWLKQFKINKSGLDCGGKSDMTYMLAKQFKIPIGITKHDLDSIYHDTGFYDNIFIFEVIEHLLNPLLFMIWVDTNLAKNGSVYLSTPILRPKWMRNKELHFHEFNYNELMYLIDKAGFKIVDEKIINPTRWYFAFTGIRPFLRVLGFDRNILLRLKKRKQNESNNNA